MSLIEVAAVLQEVIIGAGVFLNSLLIYVIIRHTNMSVGFYKWLMASFAFYELLYGLAAMCVVPIHFVAFRSWIAFSYHGPFSFTSMGKEITSLYCMLYGSWLVFVLCNYIYRYLTLCKHHWLGYISGNLWLKILLFFMFVTFLCGTTFCAYYSCRVHEPTEEALNYIHESFGVDTENMSYIMVRVQDPVTGEVSTSGIVSIIIHIVFLLSWLTAIGFCSCEIYRSLNKLQNIRDSYNKGKIVLEKQLFLVLILQANESGLKVIHFFQTVIPLLFCGVPSIIHFTFALWDTTAFFSPLTPFFTFFSSIPKLLDPLVALLFIKSYRCAVKRIIGLANITSVHTIEQPATGSNQISTPRH